LSEAARKFSGQALSNTLGLASVAARQFPVASPEEVFSAIDWARSERLPLVALGEGSNVVLPPRLEAAVLEVTDDSVTILAEADGWVSLRVGAGKNWHALVEETLAQGLYGLENLALIPGRVGAAPVQNIGAYGREVAEFVLGLQGVDLKERRLVTLTLPDCHFGYRDSVFKHALKDRFLIMTLDLRLSRTGNTDVSYPALAERLGDGPITSQSIFDAVVSLRREKLPDPSREPNAGSFFKNPVLDAQDIERLRAAYPGAPLFPQSDGRSKTSAAWLIDRCALRGFRLGRARVSERHALVITTETGATQAEVLQLAEHVMSRVTERFGIRLEIEPRVYD
jgi:UDP-N-acetylmuramate dehydrogenase